MTDYVTPISADDAVNIMVGFLGGVTAGPARAKIERLASMATYHCDPEKLEVAACIVWIMPGNTIVLTGTKANVEYALEIAEVVRLQTSR